MKKVYDDNIFLCSNRTDRKIPVHRVSGSYYTDSKGFTVFELDQTKRKLANNRITLTEGCFLLTEENCYKIATLEFAEKRPKTATCTTVVTDVKEIPFYHKFNFKKGTYFEKRTA